MLVPIPMTCPEDLLEVYCDKECRKRCYFWIGHLHLRRKRSHNLRIAVTNVSRDKGGQLLLPISFESLLRLWGFIGIGYQNQFCLLFSARLFYWIWQCAAIRRLSIRLFYLHIYCSPRVTTWVALAATFFSCHPFEEASLDSTR